MIEHHGVVGGEQACVGVGWLGGHNHHVGLGARGGAGVIHDFQWRTGQGHAVEGGGQGMEDVPLLRDAGPPSM